MVVLWLLTIRRRLKDLVVVLLRQLKFRKLLHIGHSLWPRADPGHCLFSSRTEDSLVTSS